MITQRFERTDHFYFNRSESIALAIMVLEQRGFFKSSQCDTHLEVKLEIEDNVLVKRGYSSLQ